MEERLKKQLSIRYLKMRFTVVFPQGGELPENKASALRGGMGEMLLQMHCISDRKCETCSFIKECTIQRTMYSQMEITPPFMGSGDSVGYIIECTDLREKFPPGGTMEFQFILLGKTIVHFKDFLRAFMMLGKAGLGKNNVRFQVSSVQNSFGGDIYDGRILKVRGIEISTVCGYVESRLKELLSDPAREYELRFYSPVSIRKDREDMEELRIDAILWAARRRLYVLNCFEGTEMPYDSREVFAIPEILGQESCPVSVKRYSTRSSSMMRLNGIEGSIRFRNIGEELLGLLLAGELLHIGKSSSFGFGGYKVIQISQ